MTHSALLGWMPGPFELIFIGVVAILVFGRRLPDAARSMGRSIVEFKKGLKEVKDDVDRAGDEGSQRSLPADQPAADSSATKS